MHWRRRLCVALHAGYGLPGGPLRGGPVAGRDVRALTPGLPRWGSGHTWRRWVVTIRPQRAYLTALDADARQYAASISLSSREIEIKAGGDLPVRAAMALVRTRAYDRAVTALEQGRARMLGDVLARDRADLGSLLTGAASAQEAARRFAEIAARIRTLEAVERTPSLLA